MDCRLAVKMMPRNSFLWSAHILFILGCAVFVSSQSVEEETKSIGCQEKSISGRTYKGNADTTVDGILCQKWSERTPHMHTFNNVGDHNFCRNPDGSSQVWCFTTDPKQERGNCSVPFCPPVRALDFSLDNDQQPDENNSYTEATLHKKDLPSTFTICTAFMLEAFPTTFTSAKLFVLTDEEGEWWLFTEIYATSTYTEWGFKFMDSHYFLAYSDVLFYPLQWVRVCFSISIDPTSKNSTVIMVADGHKWIEDSWVVKNKPDNLDLILGLRGNSWRREKGSEQPGRTANLNIFSSALPVDQMILMTSPGEEECSLGGDFLNWEKSYEENLWNIDSHARWMDLDGGFDSPCAAKPTFNLFPMNKSNSHYGCMTHCKKLAGRSPSVKTKKEWETFLEEMEALSPDPLRLPKSIWLSATEGLDDDEDADPNALGEPGHWPEEAKAAEGLWRDYYSGEPLENYTKPWGVGGDGLMEDLFNCVFFHPREPKEGSWGEWQCNSRNIGCPCTYQKAPLLRLRGYCGSTYFDTRFTVTQFAAAPLDIIMVSNKNSRIQYNSTRSQWVMSHQIRNVTARSSASQGSYALGKHNWTITGDNKRCFKGKEYTQEMKLTGCNKTQFTCDNGECVKMEERCNQIPDCVDTSDELNCRILKLKSGYNKRVPPVGTTGKQVKTLKPVEVNVSMTLYKIVAVKEDMHSIQLQFQISLRWKDNRATYYNLKPDSYLNALSLEEINSLWLPLVVYVNTDQQLTTRLGWVNEWKTNVNVLREGNFTRNWQGDLDETYLFKGSKNSLVMTQSYTHDFQCVYQLERYPFDTQVKQSVTSWSRDFRHFLILGTSNFFESLGISISTGDTITDKFWYRYTSKFWPCHAAGKSLLTKYKNFLQHPKPSQSVIHCTRSAPLR